MTQLDDQTSVDATTPSIGGPSLTERVAAKLDQEGVSPANAAMTIGIAYPQLVSLLGGKKPPMKALLRIEAWLQGQPSDQADTGGDGDTHTADADDAADAGIVEIVHDESLPEDPQSPAPRRRGRPPKSAAASIAVEEGAEPAAPRKRGRPPKTASTDTDASSAPKRRGRPPKTRDVAAAAPKRRGRPPKAARADASPAAPKRRGRPPKDRSASEKSEEATPKRRGRPPKNPQAAAPTEPKRRGRPPGSKTSHDRAGTPAKPSDQEARGGLGGALREIIAIADDALAVAIHRASKGVRDRVAALLDS